MSSIPTAATVARSTVTAGILFMLASITLYSCLDALAKWTVSIYAASQFLLIRSVTRIAVLLPFVARNNFAALKNVPRPGLQLLRVVLAVTEVMLFFTRDLLPAAGRHHHLLSVRADYRRGAVGDLSRREGRLAALACGVHRLYRRAHRHAPVHLVDFRSAR